MAKLHYDYEEGFSPRGVRGFFQLQVVLGVLVLSVVNLGLLYFSPLAKVEPDSLPAAHTWVWWATQEFVAQKKAPDVVLMGSSLVMHPVSRQDANHLGKDIDYVKHHRSNYMEELLRQAGVGDTLCYNFALPGGMVSDDYMVARALFPQHKPAVMVLGLSIRDFIDNGVHCAGATPAFKYLKRYTPIDDLVEVSMPQLWQRFDFLCGKGLYLWGKKLDLQVLLAEKTKAVLAPVYGKIFPPSLLAQADPERNQPSNLRAEVEEGMMIVQHNQPYSFEDNSTEYRKRYRSPNEKGFAVQKYFFERLLQLADQQGIKVVIVNMPLTEMNHKLMPAGSYDKYVALLQDEATQHHCDFIDLDAAGKFDLSNYYDTSHMNGSGGKKFIDALVQSITSEKDLVAALKRSSGSTDVASRGHAI